MDELVHRWALRPMDTDPQVRANTPNTGPDQKSMSKFSTHAIPETTVDEVRATQESPRYGYPAHVEVATGYGPCRYCLRTFDEGTDRRILFTYDPFDGLEPLPLPSPVFIHEAACNQHPVDGGFPDELRFLPLTLNGYGKGRILYAQEYVTDGDVEPVIEQLLARPEIDYIHVRNTEAGCYLLRIERTDDA